MIDETRYYEEGQEWRDDLDTMEDPATQLEQDGITDYEEGLIRGFEASA